MADAFASTLVAPAIGMLSAKQSDSAILTMAFLFIFMSANLIACGDARRNYGRLTSWSVSD